MADLKQTVTVKLDASGTLARELEKSRREAQALNRAMADTRPAQVSRQQAQATQQLTRSQGGALATIAAAAIAARVAVAGRGGTTLPSNVKAVLPPQSRRLPGVAPSGEDIAPKLRNMQRDAIQQAKRDEHIYRQMRGLPRTTESQQRPVSRRIDALRLERTRVQGEIDEARGGQQQQQRIAAEEAEITRLREQRDIISKRTLPGLRRRKTPDQGMIDAAEAERTRLNEQIEQRQQQLQTLREAGGPEAEAGQQRLAQVDQQLAQQQQRLARMQRPYTPFDINRTFQAEARRRKGMSDVIDTFASAEADFVAGESARGPGSQTNIRKAVIAEIQAARAQDLLGAEKSHLSRQALAQNLRDPSALGRERRIGQVRGAADVLGDEGALRQQLAQTEGMQRAFKDPAVITSLREQARLRQQFARANAAAQWQRMVAEQGKFRAGLTMIDQNFAGMQTKLQAMGPTFTTVFAAGSAALLGFTRLASPVMFERFTYTVQDLGAVIGQGLIPHLEALTGRVRRVADWYFNLDAGTKELISDTVLWGTGLAAAGLILPKIIGLVRALMLGVKSLSVAMLATPWGLLLGGGALLTAGILSAGGGSLFDGADQFFKEWDRRMDRGFKFQEPFLDRDNNLTDLVGETAQQPGETPLSRNELLRFWRDQILFARGKSFRETEEGIQVLGPKGVEQTIPPSEVQNFLNGLQRSFDALIRARRDRGQEIGTDQQGLGDLSGLTRDERMRRLVGQQIGSSEGAAGRPARVESFRQFGERVQLEAARYAVDAAALQKMQVNEQQRTNEKLDQLIDATRQAAGPRRFTQPGEDVPVPIGAQLPSLLIQAGLDKLKAYRSKTDESR